MCIDKAFLLTSNFCPQVVVCLCPEAIYMYKIIKTCIKSVFKEIYLKLATNGQSDKTFLFTSTFCLRGVVCPIPWGYIQVVNHYKMCMKSDFKEFLLKLATNGQLDKAFLYIRFCLQGVVCLCPGAIYIY